MTAPIDYSPALEDKLYLLLNQMRNKEIQQAEKEGREYGIHGLCAILGYDPKKHFSYFNIPGIDISVGKDLFKNQEIYLKDAQAFEALQEAMEIDGAILIGKDGKIMHSGQYILPDLGVYSKKPEAVATYKHLKETADGGTRHLNAIALSAELPDLLFYTLKSDHPQLRIFKGGSIYRSTVPGEAKIISSYQPELV